LVKIEIINTFEVRNTMQRMITDCLKKHIKQAGFRWMHRRNGEYWIMLDKPLNTGELSRLFSTDLPDLFSSTTKQLIRRPLY
jgi:hypothetical protein